MSSYGDGNTYRGTSCKDSEVPTYRPCTPEEELELSRAVERDLRERIRELETALHLIRNETQGRDVLLFEIARDALEQSDE